MIVSDLVKQSLQLVQFWLPLVSGLCLIASVCVISPVSSARWTRLLTEWASNSVTLCFKTPPSLSPVLLRLLTVPSLISMAATLWRPSSISINRDWLLLPPALAAIAVFIDYGGLRDLTCVFEIRVWSWALPAATIGMAREVETSLNDGVKQAQRMNQLLYDSPGA